MLPLLAALALTAAGPVAPFAAPFTAPRTARPTVLPDVRPSVLPDTGARLTTASADGPGGPSGPVHPGRDGRTTVRPPRLAGADAALRLDGVLDEPAWRQAARLTGFSQYAPADGIPAVDSTEVLVWYSPTAIHFGIRAHAPAGTVVATLADRDRIAGDDQVQLLLGTFDDARQAVALAVNPLGVQADGTLVEAGGVQQGGFGNAAVQGQARENVDLSADFVWQSRGRLTPAGFEVEIRVPFKSLRYQALAEQRWGLHVVRRVSRLGAEDVWAPARRGAASFLQQGGHLAGLRGLERGLVLDLTPTVTQRTVGTPFVVGGAGSATGAALGTPPAAWRYAAGRPELGGTARWGITNNLTLNATVRPDFSQVEADAAQVQFDPRQALQFPERRPFFLDGIEQFAVPSNLIYTRRIVQPTAAAKLSGKVAGTDVAVLSAVDAPEPPVLAPSSPGSPGGLLRPGANPLYTIVRLQRDVGRASRVGGILTTRDAGAARNRVLGADGRLVFGGVFTATGQLVASTTQAASGAGTARASRSGPLWRAALVRNGRRFGASYSILGLDPDFEPGAGIVTRPGIVNANVTHRLTVFRPATALVQRWGGNVSLDGIWKYDAFARGEPMLERKAHLTANAQLRGGWSGGASVLVETFRMDPDLYASYWIARPRAAAGQPAAVDTVRFTGTPALPNLDWVVTLNTPQFQHVSASAFVLWGRDENFQEWASANILFATFNLTLRPTERLRAQLDYQQQRFARPGDGSVVALRHLPRVKVEYQVARPVFVRVVGQYVAARQDSLRDDSRTGAPILLRGADGTFRRALGFVNNGLRGDVLFGYQPTPGTVFFAGYGSSMVEPDALRFTGLRRTGDGFFVKWSHLFRV